MIAFSIFVGVLLLSLAIAEWCCEQSDDNWPPYA